MSSPTPRRVLAALTLVLLPLACKSGGSGQAFTGNEGFMLTYLDQEEPPRIVVRQSMDGGDTWETGAILEPGQNVYVGNDPVHADVIGSAADEAGAMRAIVAASASQISDVWAYVGLGSSNWESGDTVAVEYSSSFWTNFDLAWVDGARWTFATLTADPSLLQIVTEGTVFGKIGDLYVGAPDDPIVDLDDGGEAIAFTTYRPDELPEHDAGDAVLLGRVAVFATRVEGSGYETGVLVAQSVIDRNPRDLAQWPSIPGYWPSRWLEPVVIPFESGLIEGSTAAPSGPRPRVAHGPKLAVRKTRVDGELHETLVLVVLTFGGTVVEVLESDDAIAWTRVGSAELPESWGHHLLGVGAHSDGTVLFATIASGANHMFRFRGDGEIEWIDSTAVFDPPARGKAVSLIATGRP